MVSFIFIEILEIIQNKEVIYGLVSGLVNEEKAPSLISKLAWGVSFLLFFYLDF